MYRLVDWDQFPVDGGTGRDARTPCSSQMLRSDEEDQGPRASKRSLIVT